MRLVFNNARGIIMKPSISGLILIVVLFRAAPLFAQFDSHVVSGASAAMGDVTVIADEPLAATMGIASLVSHEKTSVAASFTHGFVSDGLDVAALAIIHPLPFGTAAVAVDRFGDKMYNEMRASMTYAIPLGDNVGFGAAFHYLHSGTSDPLYEPLSRMTFSLALRYLPVEDVSISFRAYNPIAVLSSTPNDVRVPAIFSLGATYQFLDELLGVAEIEKNLIYPVNFKFGLEYRFLVSYAFRLGLETAPLVYSFGFGIKGSQWGVDIAAQMHNYLGMTSVLSLYYSFGND